MGGSLGHRPGSLTQPCFLFCDRHEHKGGRSGRAASSARAPGPGDRRTPPLRGPGPLGGTEKLAAMWPEGTQRTQAESRKEGVPALQAPPGSPACGGWQVFQGSQAHRPLTPFPLTALPVEGGPGTWTNLSPIPASLPRRHCHLGQVTWTLRGGSLSLQEPHFLLCHQEGDGT